MEKKPHDKKNTSKINKKIYMREYCKKRWDRERKYTPWKMHYTLAKARCNNPRNASYKYYGAKGISFLLTKEEIKQIWIRDNAQCMLKPTIDRKNSKENYEVHNCRFIEQKENSGRSGEKKIAQYTKDGIFIALYKSIVTAAKSTGVGVSNIMCAANVNYIKSKTAGGFIWYKI